MWQYPGNSSSCCHPKRRKIQKQCSLIENKENQCILGKWKGLKLSGLGHRIWCDSRTEGNSTFASHLWSIQSGSATLFWTTTHQFGTTADRKWQKKATVSRWKKIEPANVTIFAWEMTHNSLRFILFRSTNGAALIPNTTCRKCDDIHAPVPPAVT